MLQVTLQVAPERMQSQSSSGERSGGALTVFTRKWPVESGPGGDSFTVAMFDHRQCPGGMDDVLSMAKSYIASLSGFFCVFISLKPINKRKKDETKEKTKRRLEALTERFILGGVEREKRWQLHLLDLSLVAVSSTKTTSQRIISSLDEDIPKESDVYKRLTEPVDIIKVLFRSLFARKDKKANESSCYGMTFQSESIAFCIMAINGGTVEELAELRGFTAGILPYAIPLIIAHAPHKGMVHLTVGEIGADECLLWAAHNGAVLTTLKVDLGTVFHEEATEDDIPSGRVRTSVGKAAIARRPTATSPIVTTTTKQRCNKNTWHNLVSAYMIHLLDETKRTMLELKEDKLIRCECSS